MKILVFSKDKCPWCDKAKALLSHYNFCFIEKKLDVDYTKEDLRDLVKVERLTVPQIVINETLIGGYEDLCRYFEDHGIFGVHQ